MTEFRTIVRIEPVKDKIGLRDAMLTTGSCFADAMGSRFIKYKFNCLSNPFAATYNPLSIHDTLKTALSGGPLSTSSFLKNQQLFFNYNFHSQWHAESEAKLKSVLESELNRVGTFLRSASVLIITYGTAWVYDRKDTGETVANCHKLPGSMFLKKLLGENEIVSSFTTFYEALKAHNPKCKTIITVSPVRHIKDTLELNAVSKSVLRSAVHTITQQHPDVDYFPAYEMMIDDLRDYRFYKSDMIHPTQDAEEYIWKGFARKYFDDEAHSHLQSWDEIVAALNHRPFHPHSENHQRFLRETLKKLRNLKSPIDVSEEIAAIESQLIH
jgi:hypothetical protein